MTGEVAFRLGIDVGGTFTDFTLLDESDGGFRHFKVASTRDDPSAAIAEGIDLIFAETGIEPTSLVQLGHGTTVATNMVIERRGSRTALLTTKGFRDVLEVGRQDRPHLYDIQASKPAPLAPRDLSFGIDERITAAGEILRPLDDADVEAVAARLRDAEVEAVAIGFLHAYRWPDHERRAREIVERVLPGIPVSISSDVLPEFREYERLSTTVLNAYVAPRMGDYLDRFRDRVRATGIAATPSTVHSNGGLMSPGVARLYPVRTCLSGPAAGVMGASVLAAAAGHPDAVTFDVGGTSTDVSMIVDGRPGFTSGRSVAGHPVRCPMVDIHVIGAGGGSIARLDDAGALYVGPESAAADPGPAAYGRGGEDATITDANIALHRLNPVALLDGRMPVDAEAARAAIRAKVAAPLGIELEAAARGILSIAVANMARAIRTISIERGHDVERFALVAYGGAGPLHASMVAREVGIKTVLVPASPGTMCARGVLLSDMTRDFVATRVAILDQDSWRDLSGDLERLRSEAEDWLAEEGIATEVRRLRTVVEARYLGQNHEIQVESDLADIERFREAFHAAHAAVHGYDLREIEVELVTCRLQAIGLMGRPVDPVELPAGTVADAVGGERRVYLDDRVGWTPVPILRRDRLPADEVFEGPAIVEEMTSTTVVPEGATGRVDRFGNIVLEIGEEVQ